MNSIGKEKLISIQIFCFLILFGSSCEYRNDYDQAYLESWLGDYEGVAYSYSSYPREVNGQYEYHTDQYYNKVYVLVTKGSQDSTMNLKISLGDSSIQNKTGLKFSVDGTHSSTWGSGSSYGSINIKFFKDSMSYKFFQKCGIPCNSGTDFVIQKR